MIITCIIHNLVVIITKLTVIFSFKLYDAIIVSYSGDNYNSRCIV